MFKRFASSVHLLLQNTLSIYQNPNTGFKQQRLNPKSFVFRTIIKSSLHHACEKKDKTEKALTQIYDKYNFNLQSLRR